MTLATVGILFVALLCAFDLVLTFGVIRRLREHERLLAPLLKPQASLAAGSAIPDFEASTVDGTVVNRDRLAPDTLFGFLSPSCPPCSDELPAFVEYARKSPAGHRSAVAVVVADSVDTDELVSALQPVARVIVEPPLGPLASAFQMMATPTFLTLDGGVITRSGHSMTELLANRS